MTDFYGDLLPGDPVDPAGTHVSILFFSQKWKFVTRGLTTQNKEDIPHTLTSGPGYGPKSWSTKLAEIIL